MNTSGPSASLLSGPIYGLTLVPRDLDEEFILAEDGRLMERGVSAIINYVLVPLAVIYAAILHFYAAKIALTWELPEGQIGTMVMLFGFGMAATYLIARPWAERGMALLETFSRILVLAHDRAVGPACHRGLDPHLRLWRHAGTVWPGHRLCLACRRRRLSVISQIGGRQPCRHCSAVAAFAVGIVWAMECPLPYP